MDRGLLPYLDESGFNVDNQMLVFKVTMTKGFEAIGRVTKGTLFLDDEEPGCDVLGDNPLVVVTSAE